MDYENSTGTEVLSGESAGVVDPQETESRTQDVAGQETVVGSQKYHNSDFDMVDVGEDGGEKETKETPQPEGAARDNQEAKAQQSREENAAIRAARLRAQRDAEAAATARVDAEIAASGAVNPYTGKPFSGLREFQEYGRKVREAELSQKAAQSGRSVDELREERDNMAWISEQRRAAERRSAQEEAQRLQAAKTEEFLRADVQNFVERHPEFGVEQLEALEANQQFRRFCGSRYGREPLADLYDDYLEMVGSAGAAAVQKAASKAAKTTGSGTTGGVVLTPAQKNALDKWNDEYPEMAMTAKEFLGR